MGLNLGFKAGDLLETKNPVWLERAGDYYTIRYGSRGRPRSKFAYKELTADHPYRQAAEKSGWEKNLAKLEKLVGLITKAEIVEDDIEGDTLLFINFIVDGAEWKHMWEIEKKDDWEWKPI